MSDAFSSGPYRVEILTGNDQRRFEIKDERYSSPSPPSTVSPPAFLLNGETIYLCPNATANATVRPISTSTPGMEEGELGNRHEATKRLPGLRVTVSRKGLIF